MENLEDKVVSAYDKVRESVVSISTVKILDFFFVTQPIEGIGSGFVVASDGLIVTNSHVVEGFERIQVTLPSGESFRASLLGLDRKSDIALLRIPAGGLKATELGDSDKLRVGQFVVAVGNPFSHILGGPTVTFGVISGLGRTIRARDRIFENLIQTDAAINPGNSGGPLVDLKGRVIGMNTAMIPFAQGIGFAVPINEVKMVVDQLAKYGRVVRPWIGIYGATLTRPLARQIGATVDRGVVVVEVVAGSPAHRAGIRRGDVIVGLSGEPVNTMEELRAKLRSRQIGEMVRLDIVRGDRKVSLITTLKPEP